MRARGTWAGIAMLVAAGAGCREGRAPLATADMVPAAEQKVARGPAGVQTAANAGAPATADKTAAPSTADAFAALKLIRTAELMVEVERYETAAQQVQTVAERVGGYVATSQSTRGAQGKQSGSLSIRVPAARFDEALLALRGLGTLRKQDVATQDVTRAYADLETRLQVKRATADRLKELLRTRTASLSDVLNAEQELARVSEEIERMEGERRFYDHQVALSTISLTLSEPQALVEPGVFAPLGNALRDSAGVLVQSLAALLYLLVALAPWLAVLFVIWRIARALYRRRKPAAVA